MINAMTCLQLLGTLDISLPHTANQENIANHLNLINCGAIFFIILLYMSSYIHVFMLL